MNTEYISKIRELCTRRAWFSQEKLSVLTSLFEVLSGEPPTVSADRFRADNCQWIQTLNDFEHKLQFLKRTTDGRSYLFNPYALPLIEIAQAVQLLILMEKIYQNLKELYRDHLQNPVEAIILIDGIDGYDIEKKEDKEQLFEALYYLSELSGIWSGKTSNFPFAEESTMCIAENVLENETIGDIIMEFYQHYGHMNSSLSKNSSMNPENNETNLPGSNTVGSEIVPVQPEILGKLKWILEKWRILLKPRNILICVASIVILLILRITL